MVLQPLFVHGCFEKCAQKKLEAISALKKLQVCRGEKKSSNPLAKLWYFTNLDFLWNKKISLAKSYQPWGPGFLVLSVAYRFDVWILEFQGWVSAPWFSCYQGNPGEGTMIITTTTFTPHQRRLFQRGSKTMENLKGLTDGWGPLTRTCRPHGI